MKKKKKYNSIENTFDKGFIEHVILEGFDKQEFVVQEKVHGSNVCFATDGKTVVFGKRTSFIEDGEIFYEYEKLLERYTQKVIDLFSNVKKDFPAMETLTVFGEMFGGKYPHPDVQNEKIMVIQKGVYYCPNHEFYAFDLYVKTADIGFYLTVDEVNTFFESLGFIYAKTLFRGAFDDCMQYPNDSQSRLPQWLGLPPIEDNVCEGIVIRPVKPTYLYDGTRVMLKSKNELFAEKKSRKKRITTPYVKPTYSEELNDLLPTAEQYITENRLNNVVSKIGQVSMPKEIGKLICLFNKDILEDFLKEHASQYLALDKIEQKMLNRHVNTLAISLIKQVYFLRG
jgi:Rnl2 family RNA ligase